MERQRARGGGAQTRQVQSARISALRAGTGRRVEPGDRAEPEEHRAWRLWSRLFRGIPIADRKGLAVGAGRTRGFTACLVDAQGDEVAPQYARERQESEDAGRLQAVA